MRQIYDVTGRGQKMFSMSADLADPAAPLRVLQQDGSESSTPYQTADADHNIQLAAYLVARYLKSQKVEGQNSSCKTQAEKRKDLK
jgi:hypothetical protein